LGARYAPGASQLGDVYQSIGANAWTGTRPTLLSGVAQWLTWGRAPGYTSLSNMWGSFALYSASLVDLSAGGVEWSDFDALDYAIYQRQIASGTARPIDSKYYDDTLSDPEIVVP